jgi:polyhydroxybutyrate depolymerase
MRAQFILLALILTLSCQKDEETSINYEVGRTDVQLMVGGEDRHFALHLPASYDHSEPTPVVFMLHGSSGDGDRFYRISGWTEVSDSTGIIAVFPSSGGYCIEEDGTTKNTTKWNTYRRDWDFCNGMDGLDDQAFLRAIVDHLHDNLNVDLDKVYLAGFSNGGVMASQCAVEMGDLFAALVANAGTYLPGAMPAPVRDIPFMLQVGNEEDFLQTLNGGQPFPLNRIEDLLTIDEVRHVFDIPISIFDLSDQYTREGNINQQACLTFPALDPASNVEYRFCLVNKLAHNYPNGRNHPFHAAWDQWQWMKQFRR